MNAAAAIVRLFRLTARGLAVAGSFGAKPQAAPRPPVAWSRRSLVWFVASLFALYFAAFLLLDVVRPSIRDPEYGRRVASLRSRIAEHPGRPLVLVIGSSRVSMGLRPTAWEETRPNDPTRPDPLIFNMSLVGSGPVMELMCLRRVYADGFRPAAVVLEYWPPFLREDGPYFEPDRIDHARLSDADRPLIHEYFWSEHRNPTETEHEILLDRLRPLYRTRHRLLSQLLPRWQPWDKRLDMAWGNLDGWGWLAGIEEHYPAEPKMRALRVQHCEKIYRPQFQGFTIHPLADKALRETVNLARSNGAKVAFAYLPEATEFRSWIPPEVDRLARDHLARLRRELDVPLIDARRWLPDGYLVDGFHLSRIGAVEFTKRFGPAVAATFPDLGGGR